MPIIFILKKVYKTALLTISHNNINNISTFYSGKRIQEI